MSDSTLIQDVQGAIARPSMFFGTPAEVVTAKGLSRDDRRRILESWVRDAQLLSEAETEGMQGPGRPHLREARQALLRLDQQEASSS